MKSALLVLSQFAVLLLVNGESPPSTGPYATTWSTITGVTGMQGSGSLLAVYPSNATSTELFPLISFSHGDFGGSIFVLAYLPLLKQIASFGFVVFTHESCYPTCNDSQYLDQLRVLDC